MTRARRGKPWIRRARWASTALAGGFLALFTAGGCGGKVVYGEPTGGSGGAGGGGAECVLGKCGDLCTKCVGQTCVNGKCDSNGACQPPDVTFTCGK
jgi:hypothetical protein